MQILTSVEITYLYISSDVCSAGKLTWTLWREEGILVFFSSSITPNTTNACPFTLFPCRYLKTVFIFIIKFKSEVRKDFITSMFTHTRNLTWQQELPLQRKVQIYMHKYTGITQQNILNITLIKEKNWKWNYMQKFIEKMFKWMYIYVICKCAFYKCNNFGFYKYVFYISVMMDNI